MADKFLTPNQVIAGSTSVSIYFNLQDETTTAPVVGKVAADIVGSFWRQGGTRTAISMTNLAAVNSAYSAGGMKEVDAANMPGLYRVDVPDAALAAGADWVVFTFEETGSISNPIPIALPTYVTLRDALVAKVVETEGSITLQQALSIMLAALAGVTATGGTVLKSPNGVATRISATINPSNERTAMTLTPSA